MDFNEPSMDRKHVKVPIDPMEYQKKWTKKYYPLGVSPAH